MTMSEETKIEWTQERIEKAADLLEDVNAKICSCTILHDHEDEYNLARAMNELQQLAYDIQTFLGPFGNGPEEDQMPTGGVHAKAD